MSLYDVTLTVDGDVISVFDVSEIIVREEFTKARQFEISVLDEARASWTLDEDVMIEYGFDSPKILIGRLEGIDKRGALAILTGRDVSYETLDRPVDKEYTDTEVVAIMKNLIDTYADGVLFYENAAASAYTISSIYPKRISMMDAFNKLIGYAESVDGDDFIWYLDHNKDLHTFAEGDVDNDRTLEWMIEIFDYRRIRDSWRAYDKVTVFGGLDTDGIATLGSAGAGSREKIVIDEFLTTDLACSQRAVTELKKTAARDVYALTCILASDGPTIGERVFVSLDPEEIEMGFIVYAVEDHLYSGVTVIEVGESVAGFTDTMIDEHVLDEYMKQIKPGAATDLEGDYTTWSFVWTRDYGAAVDMVNLLVNNSGTTYVDDSTGRDSYVRTYAGVETNIADYRYYMFANREFSPMSTTGKYMLGSPIIGGNHTVIEVWQDEIQIFSRDVALDDANVVDFFTFSISPNGKFIAILSYKLAQAGLVTLYEGS